MASTFHCKNCRMIFYTEEHLNVSDFIVIQPFDALYIPCMVFVCLQCLGYISRLSVLVGRNGMFRVGDNAFLGFGEGAMGRNIKNLFHKNKCFGQTVYGQRETVLAVSAFLFQHLERSGQSQTFYLPNVFGHLFSTSPRRLKAKRRQ